MNSLLQLKYVTQFDVSSRFFAEEFGVNNIRASISSYQDGIPDVEKKHWLWWKLPDHPKNKSRSFKLATPKG